MNETHGPWLRAAKNNARYMMDVEVALLALLTFSFACYGWRPVLLTALSVLSAVFCELFGNAMRHQRPSVFDGAALVTGTTVGLLMSPLTAYWVPVLASAFAVVVVKLPFGGTGRNLFNPAAAGMALATQCFPTRVFTYPDIAAMDGDLPLGALPEGFVTRLSPAAELAAGAKANFSFSDLLWGKISGPIGATAVLVLVAAALFLFLRRTASPSVTLPFLAVCVIISVLFPRSDEGGFKYNMALEVCSGYLLFAGIFMLNDPVTSPRHTSARIVYGVLAGILTMLLRHFGRFEEGTCFAVLLMNAFAAPIDRGCWYFSRFLRDRRAVKRGERA